MSLLDDAAALRMLPGAEVIAAADIGTYAVELATAGWAVFPLRGKIPAIRGGRGVLDATTDLDQVIAWWSGEHRGANIGARVPEQLFVVDIDPRNGGTDALAQLTAAHGPLPATRTTLSGRGDGGRHLYFRHPGGRLSSTRLGAGIDIKTSAGYCVMPPSIHPASGQPYRWVDGAFAAPPAWLVDLVTLPAPAPTTEPRSRPLNLSALGGSIADDYSASASWADILGPHGWRCLTSDPDADGARWRHPTATSPVSATVRHGVLFVYSPNAHPLFPVTGAGDVHGITRFRAHAVLNHGGDMSAAARALRLGAAA